MAAESQQIIEVLTSHFKTLVTEHWLEMWSYRDVENNKPVRASIAVEIKPDGRDYVLTSRIAYGIRVTRTTSQPFSPIPQEKPRAPLSEPLLRAG